MINIENIDLKDITIDMSGKVIITNKNLADNLKPLVSNELSIGGGGSFSSLIGSGTVTIQITAK